MRQRTIVLPIGLVQVAWLELVAVCRNSGDVVSHRCGRSLRQTTEPMKYMAGWSGLEAAQWWIEKKVRRGEEGGRKIGERERLYMNINELLPSIKSEKQSINKKRGLDTRRAMLIRRILI